MGFLEKRKRKKKYSNQVCPECDTPLSRIQKDFEFKDYFTDVNIGGKLIGREVVPINLRMVGKIRGFECGNSHKWTDSVDIRDIYVKCPRNKCTGFLKHNKIEASNQVNHKLECENLNQGCYVEIPNAQKMVGRVFKKYRRGMDNYVENESLSDGWSMEFYTPLGKKFAWYSKLRVPEDESADKSGYADFHNEIDEVIPEGSEGEEADEKDSISCPVCGTDLSPEAELCYACGANLNEEETEEKDVEGTEEIDVEEIRRSVTELKEEEQMIDTRKIEVSLENNDIENARDLLEELEEKYSQYRETIEQLKSLDKKKSSLAKRLADGEIDRKIYEDASQSIEDEKAELEEKLNKLRKKVIHEDYEKPF